MGIIELLLLAVGLSMDAFAVSICKGLALRRVRFRQAAICGVWFGGFQALMPLVGYILGAQFADSIHTIAPWIAFALLCLIGANMIREAFAGAEEVNADLGVKSMLLLAIATSIDALSVGITFACVPITILSASALVNTLLGVAVIGVVTFAFSCVGVKIGNVFGARYRAKAEIAGGVILILIGLKILLEALL